MSRDLVAEVMKRILTEIEKPSHAELSSALPDVEAHLRNMDAFVNRLLTAASPDSATSCASRAVEYTSGTRPISLRIPNRVINSFRAESMQTGTSYQTLMIRALADATEDFAL